MHTDDLQNETKENRTDSRDENNNSINSIDLQYSSENSENCHKTNLLDKFNCSTNDNFILVFESDHKDLSEILEKIS